MKTQPGVATPEHYRFIARRRDSSQPDVCLQCNQPIAHGTYFWISESGTIKICQPCAPTRWPRGLVADFRA